GEGGGPARGGLSRPLARGIRLRALSARAVCPKLYPYVQPPPREVQHGWVGTLPAAGRRAGLERVPGRQHAGAGEPGPDAGVGARAPAQVAPALAAPSWIPARDRFALPALRRRDAAPDHRGRA